MDEMNIDIEQVGDVGETCLWIAFAGLAIPCLFFLFSACRMEDGKRYYHLLSFMINGIASIAYFSMANGYGSVAVEGTEGFRQFWYARYVDWALTTPLMLLDLCGLAGASNDTTLLLIASDVFMIVCGLIGGLIGSEDNASWGFWLFGCFFYLPIAYYLTLGLPGSNCGSEAAACFKKAALMTVVLWTAYPIVWVLAEGTGTISADLEVILYMILDILAKSGFGILITLSRDALDQAMDNKKLTDNSGL